MSLLAPQTFAAAVFGLMRLQKAAREDYLRRRMSRQEITVHLPKVRSWIETLPDPQRGDAVNSWAGEQMRRLGWLDPGGPAEGVFRLESHGAVTIEEGCEAAFEDLKADLSERALKGQGIDPGAARAGLIVWNQQDWLSGQGQSPWSLFARHLLDIGLDLLAQYPGLAGGGPAIRPLIAAMAPHLASAYDPAADGKPAGRRLAELFAETAINTIAERPDLLSRELRWQRIISGVFLPLQEEARQGGVQALLAEERIRDLFEGPVSSSVLRLLSEHADDYFKGAAGAGSLGGIVLRSTIGELSSASDQGRLLRATFGGIAADSLVASALKAASERPELFIRSARQGQPGGRILWARGLLAEYADALRAAPLPLRPDSGTADAVISMALAVTAEHLAGRIEGRAGASPQGQLGAALGAYLLRDIFKGLREVPGSPLERFSPRMAVDLLRIIAEHVARGPHFLIGKDASPAAEGLARAVAEIIACDDTGLMTPEDWRRVIAALLQAALENPGALLGEGPNADIARVLTIRMIRHARANFERPADRPGRILFGATLREALIMTFDAASTGLLDTFATPEALNAHLQGIDLLVQRLNDLVVSEERTLRIGSRDWLRIYRFYVAAALEGGEAAILNISDTEFVRVLRLQPALGVKEEEAG